MISWKLIFDFFLVVIPERSQGTANKKGHFCSPGTTAWIPAAQRIFHVPKPPIRQGSWDGCPPLEIAGCWWIKIPLMSSSKIIHPRSLTASLPLKNGGKGRRLPFLLGPYSNFSRVNSLLNFGRVPASSPRKIEGWRIGNFWSWSPAYLRRTVVMDISQNVWMFFV